jgi:Domain of unknown function (DUF4912)
LLCARKIPLAFDRFARSCRLYFAMPDKNTNDFRVSNGPVVRGKAEQPARPFDLPDVIELPPLTGAPLLFAVARDPRTIFTYWNIDWASIFETTAPVDRQVHLRVYRDDGTEETSATAEPMSGNCYLTVSGPRGRYRVEIGYYQPEHQWNSVVRSEEVTMPPDQISDNAAIDLATIPFHLTFQRLIDLFRQSNGDALAELISRLQKKVLTEEDRALLTPQEWEILQAMNLSLDQIEAERRPFVTPLNGAALRRRAEAVLGFGGSSPGGGFGDSSWS